jgi:phage terminase large subunit-like protein
MPSWLAALLAGLRAGKSLNDLWPLLTARQREIIEKEWAIDARADQKPPAGDWLTWLLLGGRGAGKTRTGAQWVRGMALGLWPYAERPVSRIALVGETYADVREVMIEGVSGLLTLHESFARPTWLPARRRIEWPNGAVAQTFSSEDPEGLRGPQFAAAWSDELGKWRYAEETWDMLRFGLRQGERPRQVVTTTPRPLPLLKRLIGDAGTAVSRARTADNAEHLAKGFLERVVARYAGTKLGRQELDGEMIDERSDALWRRDDIERARVALLPDMRRIVVAVDPPGSHRTGRCGIVVAGLGKDQLGYVIADGTVSAARPGIWATCVVALYRKHQADAVIAEVNQGGDMVTAVLREVDGAIGVREVRATRGKWLRAEPVSALYEQGRVRHVGSFPELEDEMCDFGLEGLSNGRSPDRMDALVWALTALMLGDTAEPQVRRM